MPCEVEMLKRVPLFALLDDEEAALLASNVASARFAARQRVYKVGDPGKFAYVLMSGRVRVTTLDSDQQEVIVDEPTEGEFFGFASMLDMSAHQTEAVAIEETLCLEVSRENIEELLKKKPHAGMDMLTVLGRQYHNSQQLVRSRSVRNPNEVIEEEETFGERIADSVASFGGSWTFIILFGMILIVYSTANVLLDKKAWDPYPFILLNLFLSMLAAIQAPVIMMSQNRQDKKDRVRGEMDFEINRRAEMEIRGIAQRLNQQDERIGDLEDLLRREIQSGPGKSN
jgi:CRP/FNR family transcriptional regulator, cyclic AMP receptor protein